MNRLIALALAHAVASAIPVGGLFERLGIRRRSAHRYPASSTRAALRRHRRAQGGPGIYLDNKAGVYLARRSL